MATIFVLRGIEFNDERLAKLTIECLDNLEAIGLRPYKLTSVKLRKQNKKFGCCHIRYNAKSGEIKHNRITINRRLIEENADDKAILQTLYHEILHSMRECFDCGHDGKWAEYADLVNDCYSMNIKQYGNYDELGLVKKDERKTYKCQCDKCGKIISAKYYRAPKWYTHCERFTHHCDNGKTGNIFQIGIDK